MPTKSNSKTKTEPMGSRAQLVRGRDGGVLVILWGEDAVAAAGDWSERGYRVEHIDSGLLA
jgi:hypothetical protein